MQLLHSTKTQIKLTYNKHEKLMKNRVKKFTVVICASTPSSTFLIARKILTICRIASSTMSKSPSTILISTNACRIKKSGLQRSNQDVSLSKGVYSYA